MKIIAGLDIKGNHCVHLLRGDIHTTSIHSDTPVEIIKKLDNHGIEGFQITDIDGVFSGQTEMFELLESIRKTTSKPILFGGGIRNFDTAAKVLDLGIDQVVLATSAIKDQELLVDLLEKYPSRIVVAVDIYKEYVYIEGWEESTSVTLEEFIKALSLLHVESIIVTDISIDGTQSGVNLTFANRLLELHSNNIILSGGITKEDIDDLKDLGLEGVVIGTALYEEMIAD